MNTTPLVSVVVPTYNSEDNLRRFLNSFHDSTFLNYEIIVNDDNRTNDNTRMVIEEASNCNIPVRIIKDNILMAQARKSGAAHAQGTYLLHLDSDMEITPTLLSECVSLMEKYDALIIPEESFGLTFWAKCKWLEKKCFQGIRQMESLRFIKKNVYDKLGGHDERMIFSEDKDFDLRVQKAGYAIGRTHAHLRHNEGKLFLINTLRKKKGYSKTANVFAKKHPEHFRWQSNPIHRYIIFAKNIKYLFIHPLLYIGMIFMKTCEFSVGATMFFFSYSSTSRD